MGRWTPGERRITRFRTVLGHTTTQRRPSLRRGRLASSPASARRSPLDVEGCAGFAELGLDGLGFLYAEAADDLADSLDDVNLVVAEALEDDVELGLLFFSCGGWRATTGGITIGAAAVMPNSSSSGGRRGRPCRLHLGPLPSPRLC
jgi:hypothetical protein